MPFSNHSRWAPEPLVLNLREAGLPVDLVLAAIRAFLDEHGHRPKLLLELERD